VHADLADVQELVPRAMLLLPPPSPIAIPEPEVDVQFVPSNWLSSTITLEDR
jgi:hypothetical protein